MNSNNIVGNGGAETRPIMGLGDLGTDAWGTQKTVSDFSLFHGMFTFDVPQSMWLIEEDDIEIPNSTSTRGTSINGRLNVTSGAGSCRVFSRRHPRYQPDRGLKYAVAAGFKGANLDGILRLGLITGDENGVYFETDGSGKLYACVLNNSVVTHKEEILFPFAIDITKGNIYDIQMQWRGVGNIKFYAGNPLTGLLQLVHTIKFLGELDEVLSVANPAFSLGFYAENITPEPNQYVLEITCEDSVMTQIESDSGYYVLWSETA